MSTPQRRSRRLAAAAAAAAHCPLTDLPLELLARVISRFDSPADIARVAAVSLLFHASLALEGIRLWARERGYELPAQPEGESCVPCGGCASLRCCARPRWRGRRQAVNTASSSTARGGSSCGTAAEGEEDEEDEEDGVPGLLGHGEGVLQLNTPTRLPSFLGGERAISVAASRYFSLALTADGSVWSWGCDGQGKLGHGDDDDRRSAHLPTPAISPTIWLGSRVVHTSLTPPRSTICWRSSR